VTIYDERMETKERAMTPARRNTGEQTRAQILDVALELFAAQGFAATSTRELSERLGFTKAALYYYFRTKDDLLEALLAPSLAELAALLEGVGRTTNADTRRNLLAGYLRLVVNHQRVIQVLSQDPSVLARPISAEAAPLYDRLTLLLSGKAKPGPAERTRVRAALGGIHAAILHAEPGDPPEVVEAAALAACCGALGLS
jgi:AcrR family transcriptional regulator